MHRPAETARQTVHGTRAVEHAAGAIKVDAVVHRAAGNVIGETQRER